MKDNPKEYERLRRVIELQEEDEALESSDSRGGDRIELNKASGGEAEASWWNLAFFSWLNPLLSLGRTRPLFMKDLGTLLPHLHPKFCADELETAWKAEVAQKELENLNSEMLAPSNGDFGLNGETGANRGLFSKRESNFSNHSNDAADHAEDTVSLMVEEDSTVKSTTHYTNFAVYENGSKGSKSENKLSPKKGPSKPSLRNVILQTYKTRLLWILLPRMWRVTAGFSGPLIVQQLIRVIENPAEHAWYMGLLWTFLLFLDVFLAALIFQHFCHLTVKSEVSLKMALNALVYNKLLRLSAASKQESNIQGRILSLVGADTYKITEMLWQLPIFLLAPCLSLVSFFTVSYLLSFLSALAGYATLIVLAPVTLLVAKRVETIRQRQSALTDIRIRLSTDIFHSMKTVKLYALEEQLKKKADVARSAEIRELRSLQVYKAIARALYEAIIPIMFLTTIVTFVMKGGTLTPSNAFAVVSVYAALYWPFLLITGSFSATVESLISIRRFEEFLELDEQGEGNTAENGAATLDTLIPLDSMDSSPHIPNSSRYSTQLFADLSSPHAVSFNHASLNWSSTSSTLGALRDFNVNIPKNKLTCVVGPVGSGKTSLLNAILGELKLVSGSVSVNLTPGPIAYCPQTPFLMHMSIRDNILFGSEYDEERYNRVLEVSQLLVDLRHLVEGDLTVVGERGITLSGGQRSRVAMARAAYSKAELLLLDDPLSSLDSHVGSLLFSQCLREFLKDRTVVLVTHQLQYAAQADEVIVFSGQSVGTITAYGSPTALSHVGIDLTKLLNQFNADHLLKHGPSVQDEDEDEEEIVSSEPSKSSGSMSPGVISGGIAADAESTHQEAFASYSEFARSLSTEKKDGKESTDVPSSNGPHTSRLTSQEESLERRIAKKANRIAKEERGRGGIGESVYKFYFRHYPFVWILAIILALAHRGVSMWVQMYVGAWSSQNAAASEASPHAAPTPSPSAASPDLFPALNNPNPSTVPNPAPTGHSWASTKQFLIVFTISSLAVVAIHLIKAMTVLILSVMTGKAIYREMEERMLRGVMSFYDITPKGRISSRLSSDTDALDSKLGDPLTSILNQIMIALAAWIVAAIAVGWFALMFVPVTIGYIAVFNRSIDSFRDLTRLDGNAKSPLAGLIEETNTGLITLRSYRRQSQLVGLLHQLLDQYSRPFYYKYACDRWLAIRLSTVSALSGACIGMVGVINSKLWLKSQQSSVTPGTVATPTASSHVKNIGFVAAGLSSFLMAADVVADFMRSYTRLEAGMNSVERLEQYTRIEVERPFRTEDLVGVENKLKKITPVSTSPSDIPPRRRKNMERDSIRYERLTRSDSNEVELDEAIGRDETEDSDSIEPHNTQANPYSAYASFPSSDQYQAFKGVSVLDMNRGVSQWPSKGSIRFSSVSMRYRPGLPLALKNVSFRVRAGEKVGVVGRTGAGKSSLFSSLLSLSPLESGCISIDGVDIDTVGVGDLRSRIAIISQEPVIFAASIRFNIDPFGARTDAQLWQCLKRVHLDSFIASLPLQLDQPLSAADEGTGGSGGGSGVLETTKKVQVDPAAALRGISPSSPISPITLSYGQRQLVCVARALLKDARILLLDEASSSIDLESDSLLQHTLRTDFSHCTIITIAHRLETILDSDRVLVMESGRVVEFDAPSTLLANSSLFSSLHAHSSLAISQSTTSTHSTAPNEKQNPLSLTNVSVPSSSSTTLLD